MENNQPEHVFQLGSSHHSPAAPSKPLLWSKPKLATGSFPPIFSVTTRPICGTADCFPPFLFSVFIYMEENSLFVLHNSTGCGKRTAMYLLLQEHREQSHAPRITRCGPFVVYPSSYPHLGAPTDLFSSPRFCFPECHMIESSVQSWV